MRKAPFLCCLALLSGTARASHAAPPDPSNPIAPSVHQLLLVRAATWNSSAGSLSRYEREATNAWRAVGSAVPVSLGRHGLAWGRGLQHTSEPGPTKHEGDARSPAGVFALDTAFGAGDALPSGARGFPYLQATPTTYCVEDTSSSHYNEVIDASVVKRIVWQRWSPLRRPDGLFRFGVIVRQNSPDAVAGAGSCVFLHIWRGAHQPTVGCTAMAPEAIEQILRWLDAKARPVLVQLPEAVYQSVRGAWSLPDEDTTAPSAK